jgi:quinol monooxygenase YgiN
MMVTRRDFIIATSVVAASTVVTAGWAFSPRGVGMYGLISKVHAVPGERDRLISILVGVAGMPGCLSYIVAKDPTDPDAIWITEVWDSQASHEASLSLPSVQEAIAKGRPLIASFSDRIVTEPVGGHGLTPPTTG